MVASVSVINLHINFAISEDILVNLEILNLFYFSASLLDLFFASNDGRRMFFV